MNRQTTVINKKDTPIGWKNNPDFVYIGRVVDKAPESIPVGERGYLGNPFTVEQYGREEAIQLYQPYFMARLHKEPDFLQAVKGLYGRTLVCYCKPEPCHGDIIAFIANWLGARQEYIDAKLREIGDLKKWRETERQRLEEETRLELETIAMLREANAACKEIVVDKISFDRWKVEYLRPVLRKGR